ncbi:MAG: hypothetical protein A3G18_04935 [Rhodospirillales bacterium RIFCSPLOWO2_12_FULL_58_28]|nr:MAG: hypothetical protein A3H92_03785 [Rhodospirillales bacterium RIFCSPLOWO2_02_FULL_58_16]OHC78259.1 MAG: hypothetical protein A3G18_04935 [Rhodospirillales bacterium RIFCSPLOWO2_12_FULL_58_28]
MNIPVAPVEWKPCLRIIPSRFPPIRAFERVTDHNDIDAVFEIESLTNSRLRDETGDIQLVPPEDRTSGPGAGVIMAAFTHINPEGSRFSDGTFGVFYAANDLDTAIAETKHHREQFMRATNQRRMKLNMRVYLVDLSAALHDLRGRRTEFPLVYHNDNYAAGQHFAATLRSDGSDGIVYDSVRRHNGVCAAVFRPRLLSNCRQERHLCYSWNGLRIDSVYEKREIDSKQ